MRAAGSAHSAGAKQLPPGSFFDYLVPPELDQQAQPGVAVEVPFGPQRLQLDLGKVANFLTETK